MPVQYRAGGEIIGPLTINSTLYVRDGLTAGNLTTGSQTITGAANFGSITANSAVITNLSSTYTVITYLTNINATNSYSNNLTANTAFFNVLTALQVRSNNITLTGALVTNTLSSISINNATNITSNTLTISTVYIDCNRVETSSISGLPAPINGIIYLQANYSYVLHGNIDLQGNRIICNGLVHIAGSSSETSFLKSTGLSSSVPLISSAYTLPMNSITLSGNNLIYIDGGPGSSVALDWYGVNFVDCNNVGTIKNVDNWVYNTGAFLNSGNLKFDGTVNTIAIADSIIRVASNTTGITILSTATVGRRFRVIYSSVIVPAGSTGVNVISGAIIPTESIIFDTVNFSNIGTYTVNMPASGTGTIISKCTGIKNSVTVGQIYMAENATATPISASGQFFTIKGVCSAGKLQQFSFQTPPNRITSIGTQSRTFLVRCTLSFNGAANNTYEFGIYSSSLSAVDPASHVKSTAAGASKPDTATLFGIVDLNSGDFIELHVANTTANNNCTIVDANLIINSLVL